MTPLQALNSATPGEASETLSACCGARAWVERMVAARPYTDSAQLFRTAEQAWEIADRGDKLEAFSQHPRIGERAGGWAAQEQRGVAGADEPTLQKLSSGQRAYEARFGFIFLVCATAKDAAQLLALLDARLRNPPSTELEIAATEQAKITRIRLEKLLTP